MHIRCHLLVLLLLNNLLLEVHGVIFLHEFGLRGETVDLYFESINVDRFPTSYTVTCSYDVQVFIDDGDLIYLQS